MTANPSRARAAALALVAVSLMGTGISLPAGPAIGAASDPPPTGRTESLVQPAPPPSELTDAPGPIPVAPDATATSADPDRLKTPARRNGVAKRLPLGGTDLKETRTVRTLANGVTLTVIRRGDAPAALKRIGTTPRGPWVVRAVSIDPDVAKGRLATSYGPSVAGTSPTTELTRQANALVGVNASFFALGARHPGNPVGLAVAAGRVLSEPSPLGAEVTLLVDTKRNALQVAKLRWSAQLREVDGGRTLRVTKVNAIPRVPPACRTRAAQAKCTRPGQIAVFTAEYGKRTPHGIGTEVLLDAAGCAVRMQPHRGVRLGKGRSSIQATGAATRQVRALLKKGCVDIRHTVRDARGNPVVLRRSTAAVSGRYQLLDEGRVVVPNRTGHFFGRHPRTLAGTTWDGKIVFVTIDGRSRRSVGATLREAARVARALGVRDAINLDGGGSTTMSIRGRLVNNVSGRRERPVSDALLWRREH